MRGGGDVAVVGAGLIGLGIALELALRGADVRVFDRGEPGHSASWAGAGMLAPYTERLEDEALLELCVDSLESYPAWLEQIRALSGLEVPLNLSGILETAFDETRFEALRSRGAELQGRGVSCRLLDRAGLLEIEPAVGRHAKGGLLLEGEGCVDNRRLGRSLTAACEAAGVTIAGHTAELSVECDARRVLGVRGAHGFTPAGVVVNAAGAWAGSLPGVPAAALPPVEPVKGQMLALAAPSGFLRRTTWVPGAYLVPRDDGRLLIGATVEHEGFDERTTALGMRLLLDAALAAMPALGNFTVSEQWAGLRPGSPDLRPYLGPTPIEGLVVASGHARNGILLAPESARAIADFVESGDAAPLEAWSLARGPLPHAVRG